MTSSRKAILLAVACMAASLSPCNATPAYDLPPTIAQVDENYSTPEQDHKPADVEARMKSLIESSDIVPKDYRQQLSIKYRPEQSAVLISVYKAPDAHQTDCKIDAVLLTQKVMQAAPHIKTVVVYFYDLAQQDKIWDVAVPTAAVDGYARGRLSKLDILKAVKLTVTPANTLAASYTGMTYDQIIRKLGVIEGPAQDKRALSLLRIDDLEARGKDTSDLKKKYLHIEDLTRRGDFFTMRQELQQLDAVLAQYRAQVDTNGNQATDDREARLNSLPTLLAPGVDQ
jgi:hypothetical protein